MNFLSDIKSLFKDKNVRNGQATVFLSLVLMAVILLGAVLADLSRISAGRTLAKRAVYSAARSVLAEYGSRLNNDFGLFAIAEKESSILTDRIKNYVSLNLTIPPKEVEYKDSIDLYGFRVESVEATPLYNLGENKVFKSQILEYMKYRAPKELLEGFVNKLPLFGKTGKISDAYKKKVGIDKILGHMDKSQQKLKKKVDGDGTPGGIFVNGFNAGGSWMEAFNRFSSLCSGLDSLRESLNGLDGRIGRLQSSISGGGADDAEYLMQLLEQRDSMAESLDDMRHSFENAWNELRYGLTGDYKNPNLEAAAEVDKIVEAGKEAEMKLEELEKFLGENFNEADTFSKEFADTTYKDVNNLKKLILSGRKAEKILAGLAGNTNALDELAVRLDTIKSSIGGASGYSIPAYLSGGINGMLDKYANIAYDYEKPRKGGNADDPRKGKKEEAEQALIDKLEEDRNYLDEGINPMELPSNTKESSKDFAEEDAPYLDEADDRGPESAVRGPEASYGGDPAGLAGSVDLYDEEGSFQENALDFIGQLGKIAAGDISRLRDNIYLNEYIMGSFKNCVPALINDAGKEEDKDFQGRVKSERDTFYEAEVEYVLHGNASEKSNKLMTRAQILLVRFGLDTLHVYTDPEKRQAAAGVAAAVAGWWTGGAGIPVLANLIMCGWGMGEAVIDVRELLEGRSIPIYKLRGDWRLDIGINKSGGPKTDTRLRFSYYDYLRLFLLGVNEDKKLDRMEDLIQLDMGRSREDFRMTGCKTAIRVEAVVSMKYLFLNKAFIPASMRTEDGRHKFSILIYEGY